jgi:heavy metal efflux system protein
VQRPLAIVVVGGMLLAPLLILLVLPVLILQFSQAQEMPDERRPYLSPGADG